MNRQNHEHGGRGVTGTLYMMGLSALLVVMAASTCEICNAALKSLVTRLMHRMRLLRVRKADGLPSRLTAP